MSTEVKVRIVVDHEHVGDAPDYHEWINDGARVRANKLGIANPRMCGANWQKWICNNPDCHAFAFVSEDAIRTLIEET